jgi:hypothetical protein
LWRLGPTSARRVASIGRGQPPSSPALQAFLQAAAHSNTLQVSGRLNDKPPAIWYAASATTSAPHFAVFASAQLPRNRRTAPQSGSAFSELHYAFYLGKTTRQSDLLAADVDRLPLPAPTSKSTIPFGSTFLTLVATPAERLSGTLSGWMWWLVAVFGSVSSLAAAGTTEWLVRRRNTAERLRARVETLLGEQRGIAESLQRALLPQALPRMSGADVAARYVPGTDGTEVGGDWYDVMPQGDRRLFFVIGDVSGRGIRAAAVMASLRFAIRGFVSEGHGPSDVLASTSNLLDLRTDRHFATVLCGYADLQSGELTFASAGHLPPLLVTDHSATVVHSRVGPPIGIAPGTDYTSVTVPLPRSGMLLFFTDGLIERRGEDLDQGMARLVDAATADGQATGVGQQLDSLLAALLPDRAADDTAVVGVRWT